MRGERAKRESVRRTAERQKKSGPSWAVRMKTAAERKELSPFKDDSIGGKATSFFFTNFPEKWSESTLWLKFKEFGRIVDVFVARKTNSRGRKFGFVRFIGIKEVKEMEEKLNKVQWENFRLKANVARYGRKSTIPSQPPPKSVTVKSVIVNAPSSDAGGNGAPSYAEAVRNVTPPPRGVTGTVEANPRKSAEDNVIQILPSPETKLRMGKVLLGEVQNYDLLTNVHEFTRIEGLVDVKLSYIGGFYVMLEFRTTQAAQDYLRQANSVWSAWFRKLHAWSPDFQVKVRLASLSIIGVPPHIWRSEVFSEVAAIWGKVIIPHWCPDDTRNMALGRVAVATSVPQAINDRVEVVVEGIKFNVLVLEDIGESVKLVPQVKAGDGQHNGEELETDDSDGTFSFFDENEVRKLDGIATPGEIQAAQGESESHATRTGGEKFDDACRVNLGARRTEHQTHAGEILSDEAVPSSKEEVESNHSMSPIETKRSPTNPSPVFDKPNFCDKVQPESQKQITEYDALDDSVCFLDGEEEDLDISTWFWETKDNRRRKFKRDLKMKKMHSPCNCRTKVKRNGDGCRHAHLSGAMQVDAFIDPRLEDETSDSENLIRRNNRRILVINEGASPSSSSFHSTELFTEEVENTTNLGTGIGFKLEGFRDAVHESVKCLGEKFLQ
ncbi:hypothetical protein LXL04_009766 [Taraxacum kok-saghyz]